MCLPTWICGLSMPDRCHCLINLKLFKLNIVGRCNDVIFNDAHVQSETSYKITQGKISSSDFHRV